MKRSSLIAGFVFRTGALVLLTAPSLAGATKFYVDSAAPSGRDGMSPGSAFTSLFALQQVELRAGDEIFLRCGQTHRGGVRLSVRSADLDGPPVLLTTYGNDCATHPPTISGQWAIDHRWQASLRERGSVPLAETPARVWRGGQELPSAQAAGTLVTPPVNPYPEPNAWVWLPELRQLAGAEEFRGAVLHLRTEDWRVETRRLVAQGSAAWFRLETPFQYRQRPGSEYWIELIDTGNPTPGGWSYSSKAQRLLLGAGVNTSDLDGLTYAPFKTLLSFQGALKVHGIRFTGGGTDGLSVKGRTVHIQASRFDDLARDACRIESASSVVIEQSRFSRVGRDAIVALSSNNLRVAGNVLEDIGVQRPVAEAFAAINLTETREAQVLGNAITRTGYHAIRVGPGSQVQGNTIRSACLRLDDCAAIYTWNKPTPNQPLDVLIAKNLIVGVPGRSQGRPPRHDGKVVAAGIYSDESSNGVTITGNVIADVQQGIFQMNAFNNQLIRNLILGARDAAISIALERDNPAASRLKDTVLEGNLIALPGVGTVSAVEILDASGAAAFPRSNSNIVAGPPEAATLRTSVRNPTIGWQRRSVLLRDPMESGLQPGSLFVLELDTKSPLTPADLQMWRDLLWKACGASCRPGKGTVIAKNELPLRDGLLSISVMALPAN